MSLAGNKPKQNMFHWVIQLQPQVMAGWQGMLFRDRQTDRQREKNTNFCHYSTSHLLVWSLVTAIVFVYSIFVTHTEGQTDRVN